MKKLRQIVKDLLSYIKSVFIRKKREKKEQDDDPFIYPHF